MWTVSFFFFNDTATTEIYTLSLHDALPISDAGGKCGRQDKRTRHRAASKACLHVGVARHGAALPPCRSEEHTSELQSRLHLVCRLLLEKKNKQQHPSSRPARM